MKNWVDTEFKSLDLGDKRLNKRFEQIISGFSKNPGKPISQCFQTRNEQAACYQFLSNDYIDVTDLFRPHREATIERIHKQEVALCLNDTTSLDYTMKPSIEGLGILETSARRGFFFHPLMVVTPERIPLGTVHVNMWKREEFKQREKVSSSKRASEPIETKESFRWLQGYREACKVAEECPETEVIYIADREADIMELFVEATEKKEDAKKAQLIIRSRNDRILDDPNDGDLLRQKIKKAPKLGELKYSLKRKGKEAREVSLTVTASRVCFRPKRSLSVPSVSVYAVMAVEENPPEDEDPISWLLLTTIPTITFDDAVRVIKFYTCRWEIEMFFNVLKSGLNIEKRGLQAVGKLELLLVLFTMIAYRVMLLCKLSREYPELPCAILFTDMEWKAAWAWANKKKALPSEPPTLGGIYKLISLMGGYTETKKGAPPGYLSTWRGIIRLQNIVEGWEAHSSLPSN